MILHLLQLEWKKLASYRLFQILVGLYIVLLPLGFLIGKNIDLPDETGGTISFYTFPKVWDALGYAGNWVSFFFLGFLAVLMVTNEYAFRTVRQNIITGISREDYFWSKIFTMLVVSAVAAIYYALVAIGIGFYFTDYIISEKVFLHADLLPRYFLMCFAYMNFAFLLGILFRKMGLALFFYFIYTLLIEMVLRYYVHAQIFGIESKYRNFFPLNSFEDLAPFPIPDFGPATQFPSFFLSSMEAVTLACIYSGIFLAISYYLFQKRDL